MPADGKASLSPDNQITINLRFPGQYFDTETSLHYNTRRYYYPIIGRYVTQDPIGYSGGLNLYRYANGDPINQMDPIGEIVSAIIAGVRIAIISYDYYTLYQDVFVDGECFDYTDLIPIPVKVPRFAKTYLKSSPEPKFDCSPCSCDIGFGNKKNSFTADTLVHAQDEQGNPKLIPMSELSIGDKVLAKSE